MGGSSSRPENTRRKTRKNNNTNGQTEAPRPKKAYNKVEVFQRLICHVDKNSEKENIIKLFKTVYSRASDRQSPVDEPNVRTTARTQLIRLKELVCKVSPKELEKEEIDDLVKKVMILTKGYSEK